MRINVNKIIGVPGGSIPFDFELDLSDMQLHYQYPVSHPVRVHGRVVNIAGVLTVEGELETVLSLVCDRCLSPLEREKRLEINAVLAEDMQDTENEGLYPLDGDFADIGEIASTAFILDMDTKVLCKEDCPGICPQCGKNLNTGACSCQSRQEDPRLSQLKDFFS